MGRLRRFTGSTLRRRAFDETRTVKSIGGRFLDVVVGAVVALTADVFVLDNFWAVVLVGLIGLFILPGAEFLWRLVRAPVYLLTDESEAQLATIDRLEAELSGYRNPSGLAVAHRGVKCESDRRDRLRLFVLEPRFTNQTESDMSLAFRAVFEIDGKRESIEDPETLQLPKGQSVSFTRRRIEVVLPWQQVTALGGVLKALMADKRLEVVDLVRGVVVETLRAPDTQKARDQYNKHKELYERAIAGPEETGPEAGSPEPEPEPGGDSETGDAGRETEA